jgi:hypothetical protein
LKQHFPFGSINRRSQVSENAVGNQKGCVGRNNYHFNPFAAYWKVNGTCSIDCAVVPKSKANLAWSFFHGMQNS